MVWAVYRFVVWVRGVEFQVRVYVGAVFADFQIV